MTITGRIKELIITAGGEKIYPQNIETAMKVSMPYIQDCMCVGDRKKYIALLIALKTAENPLNLHSTVINFAKLNGSRAVTVSEARVDPKLRNAIHADIVRANPLHLPSETMYVKQWELLPECFSIEGGELGPTSKVKRPFILTKYARLIEELYTRTNRAEPPKEKTPERRQARPVSEEVFTTLPRKEYSVTEAAIYIQTLLETRNDMKGFILYGPKDTGKTQAINKALDGNKFPGVQVFKDMTPERIPTLKQEFASKGTHIIETRYSPDDLDMQLDGYSIINIPKRA